MQPPLLDHIEQRLADAFKSLDLDPSLGRIAISNQTGLGQFQCNGAFKGAKVKGCPPLALAEDLIKRLDGLAAYATLRVSPPGFINITVQDDKLGEYANAMARDPRLGIPQKSNPEKLVLDFGGMNIAKAMHVGHLRSSIIGETLQRTFRFVGDDVISDIHLGDWGLPIGMLIEEFKLHSPELAYFQDEFTSDPFKESPVSIEELETVYPQAATRCKEASAREAARQATAQLQQGHTGYRALWRRFREISIADIKKQLAPLDVHFDLWLGESSVNDRIEPLLANLKASGQARSSEGALIIEVAEATDKNPVPPLILVTSDGSITYGMTDIATIEERVQDLKAQRILYVVDNRQSLHFEQAFRAARKTDLAGSTTLEHIAFGTLNGPDGKPFKTRAGGIMKLSDLLELAISKANDRLKEVNLSAELSDEEKKTIAKLVAVAAIKFADLNKPRASDYIFDLDKFVSFQGRTGPYLLYTAVRIKSLLAKAKEQGRIPGAIMPPGDNERDILLKLIQFSHAVNSAYDERAPHHLCEFAYALAQSFSAFYQTRHILTHEDEQQASSWLGLCVLTLKCLEKALDLLGIAIPERM